MKRNIKVKANQNNKIGIVRKKIEKNRLMANIQQNIHTYTHTKLLTDDER